MKDLCKIEKQGDNLDPENDNLGIRLHVDGPAKGVGGGNSKTNLVSTVSCCCSSPT